MNGITIAGKEYKFKTGVTIGYVDKVVDFEAENNTTSVFVTPVAEPEEREKRKAVWAEYCGLIFEGEFPAIEDCSVGQIMKEIPGGFFAAQVSEATKRGS